MNLTTEPVDPKIFIVIPVHNRCNLTERCLDCLHRQTYKNFEIIVVDDGSSDGTDKMISNKFPNVKLLRGNGDLWWTEGTNVGIRYALKRSQSSNDFILTLNDDTEVDVNYLNTLFEAYQKNAPAIIGSSTVDMDNNEVLLYAGTRFEKNWAKGYSIAPLFNNSYSTLLNSTEYIESDQLTGRGMLIPIKALNKIGLLDSKRFKHYMSDIDFSVRAKKNGYRLIISTKSLVYENTKSTGIQLKRHATFKSFIQSFISTRSSTNLKVRYYFAMKHSNTKLIYFICDVCRITLGYLLRRFNFKD